MPGPVVGGPAGDHEAVGVEVVGVLADGDGAVLRAGGVLVAVLPAGGVVDPGAALVGGVVHVEVHGVGDVVIGALVLVAALGAERHRGEGVCRVEGRRVVGACDERDVVAREGAGSLAGDGLLVHDRQGRLGDGAGDGGAHVDRACEVRISQGTPVGGAVVGVLDGAQDRTRLVLEHGGQGVDQAGAAVFLAVGGFGEAVEVLVRLLLHEGDDLVGRVVGVDLLDQRGDARGVRGGHGRTRQVAEGRFLLPGGQVRPDALAGGRDVDRVLAVVGEAGALELRRGRVGAGGQLECGDGHDRVVQHGGHVDAAGDVALDGRALNVVGGFFVGRRVVVVVVGVAFGGEVNDAVLLRVAHRA